MYVSDFGDVFRFVLQQDLITANIDFKEIDTRSMININKITNILEKIDYNYEIYSLRFTTDYAASLFLTENIQMQIENKIGRDIIFCMPSSSTLICTAVDESNLSTYINLLEAIISLDTDVNKISEHIYRRDYNNHYSIIR